jgi:hypothetical protein
MGGIKDTEENDPPLGWLIGERTRVQTGACELLGLIQKNTAALSDDKNAEDVAGLMIGAAFSLWRAIFLAPKNPTTRIGMIGKGSTFLEKFLRDNSISYGDEKTNREWSFGYYLNSARFRLFHAKKIQCEYRGYPYGWGQEYDWLTKTRGMDKNIAEEWNRHIEVFEEELEEFKRHFD